MNTKQKELIKYIFDTEYKEIDKNTIAENKGLSHYVYYIKPNIQL